MRELGSFNKIDFMTRVAYGLGDTAQNVVWGAMGILTYFYTDYAGIAPSVVGLVMLLSRFFDGFSDIVMGFAVERTNSKWGKSRPWLLWASIPFAVSIVLIYMVPQGVSSAMQFAYLFVTYNLCTTVAYTMLNLPYGSLSAMMTRSAHERDMLSIFRMSLSPLGKILAVSATLPLVKIMGDNQLAWVKVMSIWAVLALIMLLFCFFKCKEKVDIPARSNMRAVSIGKSLKMLFFNRYFWLAASIWMMQNVIFGITGTVLPYYCKYIFMDDTLFSFLFLLETLVMVGAQFLLSPWLLKTFGKRKMCLYGILVALAGHCLYLLNPLDYNWVVFSCVIRGIGFAPMNSVIFGFLGDVVEYTQWKYHVRQEGLIFSVGSVGTKIGSGITAAVLTNLLAYAGYIATTAENVVQPEQVLSMIVGIYEYGPIFAWLVILTILKAWKLEEMYTDIMNELAEREMHGTM